MAEAPHHECECECECEYEYVDKKPSLSSPSTPHEDPAPVVKTEPLQVPEFSKKKPLNRTRLKEAKSAAALHPKRTWSICKRRTTNRASHTDRWSVERYKLAEQNMLDVLKAEGATFEKPISRPALRTAARKAIGDTGLLDHLLKHIDGKLAPGGAERFRRWFNRNGIMEYWLENADLNNIRQQAGVQDPYWIPPSGFRPYEDSVSAEELNLLKAEFNKMKSDMQELLSKKKEQPEGNQVGEMFKEIVKWKVETDQNLQVILSSWKGMQDMYEELIVWKAELEQQLGDIRSLLSSIQESKQHHASSPRVSEGWEDWIQDTKLDDVNVVQGNEVISSFDGTNNLVNVEEEVEMQDLYSLLPLPFQRGDSPSQGLAFSRALKELDDEMMNANKDVRDFVPKSQREDHVHVNVTPDSSTTANSLSDKSSFMCQEMFRELFNWKAEMEQKLNELSRSINIIRQSSKP